MGNEESVPAASHPKVDERIHKRFLELAGVGEPKDRVNRDVVVAILAAPGAEDFGALLYDSDERYKGKDLDENSYVHAIASSLGFADDDSPIPPRAVFYFKVFGQGKDALNTAEFTKLVRSIASLAMASFFPGRHPITDDSVIVQSIVNSAMGGHDLITSDQFSKWVAANCPDIFAGVMKWVELQGLAHQGGDAAAEAQGAGIWTITHTIPALLNCDGEHRLLVNRQLLWLLSCSLPTMYRSVPSWSLLYNSVVHGHGANRFFNHVLHYKGPTVLLVRDIEGDTIVACIDSEWQQDSSFHWGGSNCHLFTMLPRVTQYRAVKVHTDLKTRHVAHGIGIGPDPTHHHAMLFIHSDLAGGILRFDPQLPPGTNKQIHIDTVEVWGCAAPEAAAKQSLERARDTFAAEQRQKIRDPGDWLDNPDRFLLGISGISVDNVSRISTQTR